MYAIKINMINCTFHLNSVNRRKIKFELLPNFLNF